MSEHVLSILVKALGLGQTSAQMKSLDGAISSVSRSAGKGGAALSHFGGRLGQLAGAAGIVGVTGAALGLSGAFEEGIHKASDWGLAIEKLSGLTSNSAEQLSGLLAVTEKFGISNERIAQIVGFTEKTLGKLEIATAKNTKATKSAALAHLELVKAKRQANGQSTTAINKLITEQKARDKLNASLADAVDGTTKLTELQQKYGVQLTDSKGKALDFQSVLLNVADAYAKATTASDKARTAALAASVFGRGYADLLPILRLGRKGILDAEQAAKDLGLTLSKSNVEDLAKFRESTREANDAVSGLELQLGLLVVPDLTVAFKTAVSYISGHRAEIQDFFKKGLSVAEGLAAFVTGTLVPAVTSVGSTMAGAWNAIPAPLRDMIVKGAIADRTVKFLFGFSPIHTILDIGGSLLAKGLSAGLSGLIGKNIVQPVFVTNQVPGGGGLPGAAGKAGGGLASLAASAIALLGVGAVEIAIAGVAGDWLKANVPGWGTAKGAAQVGPVVIGGQSQAQAARAAADAAKAAASAAQTAAAAVTADHRSAGSILDRGGREKGFSDLTGKLRDDRTALRQLLRGVWAPIGAAITTLARSNDPKKIAAAVKDLEKIMVKDGRGNVASTKAAISALTARLGKTHDPVLQAALKGAIADLKAKLPGREYAQAQIAKADKILRSSETVGQKIAGLQSIERDLKDHKLATQTRVVSQKIDALKAADQSRLAAVRDKVESAHLAILAGTTKVSGTARKAGEVAKSGGDHAAAAIARKKMSVTVPVSVNWVTQLKLNGQQIAREDNRRSRIFAIKF